ncbi:SHOCT domain-containing protein [Arthrobacter sp. NPDC056886]|uniref:SHOCT domain-containing protein n=1 Tax=Arthrobacter sp. NPDC056886 TaxID=3345960 RepID=UPI00366B57F7
MGLLRGMARTAVVAGTASAVSGRVQRRQASKFAEKDAATAAKQQEAYDAQMAQQQPPPQAYQQPAYQQPVYQQPPPPPPPAGGGGISDDAIQQLKELGALKEQGILTDEEFVAQKAKILGT